MTFTSKNILMTGGCGFIGSHHVLYVLKNYPSVRVVNLDLLTYAAMPQNLASLAEDPRYIFVKGDIADIHLVQELLKKYHIDTVIHFAAESHVDRSITGPANFIHTNLVGTFKLLEAVKGYWIDELKWTEAQCRFHHVSTDEVYGSLSKTAPAFTEQSTYEPNSPYSASKAGSDHLARAYFHTYGLPVTISNCSNNFGPHQHAEKLIPTVIRSCKNQQPIPVYGNGSNIRDWLYVEDHCHGVDCIIREGRVGEKYNLGGENEHSNLGLVKIICHQMDRYFPSQAPHERLISFVTDRPGHDWRYAIDISKIKNELHWQPQTDFMQGLEKTIEYYT